MSPDYNTVSSCDVNTHMHTHTHTHILTHCIHVEYAYGGHPYSYSGVYDMLPRQEDEIAGEGVRFRESLRMGYTNLSEGEVGELVHTLGQEYNGNAYHVLNK